MKSVVFINKSADSKHVARSTYEERIKINQSSREHRAPKRVAQADKGTTKTKKPSAKSDTGAANGQSFSGHDSKVKLTEDANNKGIIDLLEAYSKSEAISNAKQKDEDVQICPFTNRVIKNSTDPFDSLSIPMSADDWQVIQFYRLTYYERLWKSIAKLLDGLNARADFKRCTPEEVIMECLQSPGRMWSLLASSSCNLQHETNALMHKTSLRLVQQGTESLRHDLAKQQIDRHSLLNAIHLFLASESLNLQDAAQMHLIGAQAILRKLVEQRFVLTPATLAMVSLIDSTTAETMLSIEGPVEEEDNDIEQVRERNLKLVF